MYVFKYKRLLLFKKIKRVIGHRYVESGDRMDVFKEDGVISIPNWSKCELHLGNDFILFEKNNAKIEAGME